MNESETNLDVAPEAPEPTVRVLEEEVQSLRTLLVCTILVLLVLSGALNIFLLRQASVIGFQVSEQQRVVDQFNNVNAPIARDLWNRAIDYSKNHPDFKTNVVNKYSPYLGIPAAPATAPATVPKK
ncbi:MAG TPA: hypothetical protein VN281_14380 [Verrucomicrobiae bacterium]|jgi:hypothetical protein|nr:hypothetical protein [Verrucomicrobiae bacterium]